MMIRPGRARDIPAIVAGAINFAADSYPDDKCDPLHIESVVTNAMVSEDALVAVLEGDDAQFAGVFIGVLGPNPLSGDLICAEVIIWVEPAFRGHGKKLMDYVTDWARLKECAGLVMSRPEVADRAGRTFELWGFKPTERWYRKDLAA